MSKEFIRVVGARQHNLKNLSLEIPRDRLVVITGPSGSGKSSLAFDTLFAEGQRKYVESLSAYARQFLDQMQKPEVDHIEGLSPAIAIEQRTSGTNPRSTIATTTEIYDYLRLLYAHLGQPHDPETGTPMACQSATEIVDRIALLPTKTRLMVLAPVVEGQRGEFRDVLERLQREGFVRVRVDGQIQELNPKEPIRLDAKATHTVEVVVDRIVMAEGFGCAWPIRWRRRCAGGRATQGAASGPGPADGSVDRNPAFHADVFPGHRSFVRHAHTAALLLQFTQRRLSGLPWVGAEDGF